MAIGIRILDDINRFTYIVKKLIDRNSIVYLTKKDFIQMNETLCLEFDTPFILKSEYSLSNVLSMLDNTITDDLDIISISLFTLMIKHDPFLSLNDLTAFFTMVEFRNKNCIETNIDQEEFYRSMVEYQDERISIEQFAGLFTD